MFGIQIVKSILDVEVKVVWMLNDLVFKCLSKSDQNCCHLGFPCSTGLVLECLGPYPQCNWLSNQGSIGQWHSDPRITLDHSRNLD